MPRAEDPLTSVTVWVLNT